MKDVTELTLVIEEEAAAYQELLLRKAAELRMAVDRGEVVDPLRALAIAENFENFVNDPELDYTATPVFRTLH